MTIAAAFPKADPEGIALHVEDLGVQFGETKVIEHLTFSVPRATSVAIIGPNGAGKTVLFRALIGAVAHTGSVRWAPNTRLGYLPQKLDIDRDLPITGDDLLRAKASAVGASNDAIGEALALVSLQRTAAAMPIGALSGGQFQRALLAVALVGRPTILLLDEPTSGVDEPGQRTLNDLIERLRQERRMTTLVISHDLSVVYRHATDVLCLAKRRACFGPPRTVLTPERLEDLYGAPVAFHAHDNDVGH